MSTVLSPTQNISLKGSCSHIWKRSFRVLTDSSLAYFNIIFPLIHQSPRTKVPVHCYLSSANPEYILERGPTTWDLHSNAGPLGHATLAYSISPPSFPLTPQSWSGWFRVSLLIAEIIPKHSIKYVRASNKDIIKIYPEQAGLDYKGIETTKDLLQHALTTLPLPPSKRNLQKRKMARLSW